MTMIDAAPGTHHATNLSWLIRLRWIAVASEALLVLLVGRVSDIELPVAKLLALLAFAAMSNGLLAAWARGRTNVKEGVLASALALDLALLTAMLYITGGPHNPFTALYLVHIALAPVVLSARWTWVLVALAVGGYALLFATSISLEMRGVDHATQMKIHLRGMWLAFTVAAAFIGYFVYEVQRARARVEEELAAARVREARVEKLSALATLAAGAAHELATPLSTIAIAIKEMERKLTETNADAAMIEDAHLIRAQVERCRRVLEQMSVEAGAMRADAVESIALGDLLAACVEGASPQERVVRRVDDALSSARVRAPVRSLAMAARGLVQNALDASADEVELRARANDDGDVLLEVRDRGEGMSDDVLRRAGEPFYTTKPAGRGTGLGLFLARAVVEQLGGALRLESRPREGTLATLVLPKRLREAHT
jgi:two-component system sensor histidine kinase RegB